MLYWGEYANILSCTLRGDFNKKNAYFMTSGKKVGGPQTKTKFQKKNEI